MSINLLIISIGKLSRIFRLKSRYHHVERNNQSFYDGIVVLWTFFGSWPQWSAETMLLFFFFSLRPSVMYCYRDCARCTDDDAVIVIIVKAEGIFLASCNSALHSVASATFRSWHWDFLFLYRFFLKRRGRACRALAFTNVNYRSYETIGWESHIVINASNYVRDSNSIVTS